MTADVDALIAKMRRDLTHRDSKTKEGGHSVGGLVVLAPREVELLAGEIERLRAVVTAVRDRDNARHDEGRMGIRIDPALREKIDALVPPP